MALVAAALTPIASLPHSRAMDPIEDLSFEAALKELETIVSRLESGEAPLDQAIGLYERGDRLRRRCAERLDAAQARIESIRTDGDGRAIATQPFAAG